MNFQIAFSLRKSTWRTVSSNKEIHEAFWLTKWVSVTTIKQRLAQPANQPETVKHLYPQHKNLSIKRSLRCRHCEHNVIKPEYNPSSIKYRIQLFASYHVPEIRFVRAEPLKAGASAFISLKVINPTMNDMTITIMDLPTEDEEKIVIEEMRKTFEVSSNLNEFTWR